MLSASIKRPLSAYETKLALMELYETMYGIMDHDDPSLSERPLAIMAMHPKENPRAYSALYRRIDEYHRLKLFEGFGMPLDRFLALPTEIVQYIISLAKISTREEAQEVQAALSTMNNPAGKPPRKER